MTAEDKSSTCCNRSSEGCVCAREAMCSCGKKPAMHCDCAKAETENDSAGPRCSCRARKAGECTCKNASTENTAPAGEACECGLRSASSCNCGKAGAGSESSALETDFTTKK